MISKNNAKIRIMNNSKANGVIKYEFVEGN